MYAYTDFLMDIDVSGAQSSQRALSPGAVAASPPGSKWRHEGPRVPESSRADAILLKLAFFFESRTGTLIIFRDTETTIRFLC